ncbi:MAG TPA: hypothetical protein VFE51_17520 [Verrucomicrobiae bacterium]|nr:hypothetical protein [Verrucomicrobiae bacterium]
MTPPTNNPNQHQPAPVSPAWCLNEMDQMVSAERLLELLWEESSRPTLRWLRTQQKRRAIPFTRIGRRVWFTPSQVLANFQTRKQVRVDPRSKLTSIRPVRAGVIAPGIDSQPVS